MTHIIWLIVFCLAINSNSAPLLNLYMIIQVYTRIDVLWWPLLARKSGNITGYIKFTIGSLKMVSFRVDILVDFHSDEITIPSCTIPTWLDDNFFVWVSSILPRINFKSPFDWLYGAYHRWRNRRETDISQFSIPENLKIDQIILFIMEHWFWNTFWLLFTLKTLNTNSNEILNT